MPTKSGNNTAGKLRRWQAAPLKSSSTGYKFPGGPVMYMNEEGGGGGQYCVGVFLGGGGDGGGIAGGGGEG